MGWTIVQVNKWDHLLNNVIGASGLGKAFRHPYVYRGQGDATWRLEPSLCRHFGKNAEQKLVLEVERRLGNTFIARAHLHLSPHLTNRLEVHSDRWALMQHYGAPTRLLDWTISPYVAAYFACVSHENHAGAVWAVHIDELNRQYLAAGGEDLPSDRDLGPDFFQTGGTAKIFAVTQTVHSDRLAAQQGTFTVCTNVLADHAEVIDKSLSTQSRPNLNVKFIIAPELKMEILRQLTSMNISSASLFPSLEGLGRSLHDIAKLASTYGI